MGHIQRATVQKIRIEELFNFVNKQEAETSVCIVMDYKMKYEPMCFVNPIYSGLDVEGFLGMVPSFSSSH